MKTVTTTILVLCSMLCFAQGSKAAPTKSDTVKILLLQYEKEILADYFNGAKAKQIIQVQKDFQMAQKTVELLQEQFNLLMEGKNNALTAPIKRSGKKGTPIDIKGEYLLIKE